MEPTRVLVSKRLIVILALIGLGLVAIVVFLWWQTDSTSYRGKTIMIWALQLASPDAAARDEATSAFKNLGPTAVPSLVKLLKTKDPGLRRRAWAIAVKLPRSLRAWFFRDVNWPDPTDLRTAAAKALGLIGPRAQSAIPALSRSLRDPAPQVRLETATAMARIGKESVPDLLEALDDPDTEVRHAAAYALGEIGPDAHTAVPRLLEMLGENDGPLRASVAYSLSRIGPSDLPAVMDLLEHGSDASQVEAVKVLLGYYHSLRRAVPVIGNMATNESPAVRQKALECLSVMREAEALAFSVAICSLKDPAVEVRLTAITVLGQIGLPAQTAVKSLGECLKDESPQVRASAAQSLGYLGPTAKAALPALTLLLDDKDERVRAAAREALRLINTF
jgi:HEAT repeat protein